MTRLKEGLDSLGISFNERYYPYFSLGYMAPWQLEFLTLPHFLELAEVDGRRLIVGYEPVQRDFRLLDVGPTEDFNHLVRMDHSAGLATEGAHFMEMLQVRRVLHQSDDVDLLLAQLVARGLGPSGRDGLNPVGLCEIAPMKLGTWNVNGVRAVVKKDFEGWLAQSGLDVLGLQETKAQDDQVREALFGLSGDWHVYSSSAVKKGYSGTAILSRVEPKAVTHGIGVEGMDDEGRVTAAEFDGFHFVTVYTPNSSSGLKRLPFRKRGTCSFANTSRGSQPISRSCAAETSTWPTKRWIWPVLRRTTTRRQAIPKRRSTA